ncbi:MAG: hypothetical protein ACTSXF_08200 [Promethearchaeota archaeon]
MGLFQFSFLEGDNVIILGGVLLALCTEILPRELWTAIWHYLAPLWDYKYYINITYFGFIEEKNSDQFDFLLDNK